MSLLDVIGCLIMAMKMKKLAGDAYAVHVVTRHPFHALKLMRAARRLADEALVLAGTPTDAGCRVHAEAVMSQCMLRVMDHLSLTR